MRSNNKRVQKQREGISKGIRLAFILSLAIILRLSIQAACATPDTIWSIGVVDHSAKGFALFDSYQHIVDPKTYTYIKEVPDNFQYVIGKNNPSDWPAYQPGPDDAWGGGKKRSLGIEFQLEIKLSGICTLNIHLVGSHSQWPSKVLYQVTINDRTVEVYLPPGGSYSVLPMDESHEAPSHISVRFNANLLKVGNNNIWLTTLEGSWIVYDAISLEDNPQTSTNMEGLDAFAEQKSSLSLVSQPKSNGKPTVRPTRSELKTMDKDGYFSHLARHAEQDLIQNFWIDTPFGGEITPSRDGYPIVGKPNARGFIWEGAMMVFALDSYYQATGDRSVIRMIQLEDRRFERVYKPQDLDAAGGYYNHACDDSGWNAMLYLTFYRYLGDPWMLQHAINLVNDAYNRWMDDKFGGGMWYRDERDIKSVYQAAIILDSLDIWEITHDESFYRRAMECYEWVESKLLRKDGVFFCDYNSKGPVGKSRPNDIHEASSVTFLGGTMAMGVINARLYKITKNDLYLHRALKIVKAVDKVFDNGGVYLDDRDAWSNGTFMGEWVADCLTLPGVSQSDKDILLRTAISIYKNDRTKNGYYGGSWSGPAEGNGSAWYRAGSKPRQIMTSADSVNVIMAAAMLESFEKNTNVITPSATVK